MTKSPDSQGATEAKEKLEARLTELQDRRIDIQRKLRLGQATEQGVSGELQTILSQIDEIEGALNPEVGHQLEQLTELLDDTRARTH